MRWGGGRGPMPEILDQLRAYVAEVSGTAAAIKVPAELAAQRDELKQLADQIGQEIDEPLRIGFVGEFSAGKSLLLGVLIGKPDLLPTSMEPTTGNVTELRFVPADDVAGARIDRVQVSFFTRADADQLAQRILDELRQAAQRARLPAADVAELDAEGGSWSPRFRDWCARMSRRDDAELRKLIREITLLRDAVVAAPGWLGQTVTITQEQLRTILEIPYPSFQDGLPPPRGEGSVQFASNPDGAQLIATFPLVARVILDIGLSAEVWPVSSMSGNKGFTLLDFPGIGGANTKARDLFLTRRGLEDVHTILVLVNAGRAGSQTPDTFYSFLRDLDASAEDDANTADRLSSRIVYCAGRFDEIPPPASLTEDPFDTTRMTVDRLLIASRPLNALLQSGHRPGLSAMKAFASSVLAISRLGLRNVPGELNLDLCQPAERGATRWRDIAESLSADGTGQDLVRTLRGYVKDGGVAELRQLLDQHVADNGLSLRVQKAERRLNELDERKAELVAGLRASHELSSEDPASPSVQAYALLRALRQRQSRLVQQTSQLRDPAQVPLKPGWSVRQDVMRKAADLVMAWPQWDAVFSCVQNDVVVPGTGTTELSALEQEVLGTAALPAVAGLPQQLGAFQDAFAQACGELRGYARDQALEGTRRWLEDRSGRADAGDLQRQAVNLLGAEARDRLKGIAAFLPDAIDRILRPGLIAAGLANVLKRADLQLPEEQRFPLRADQLTSWADGSPSDDGARHFIRVVRLRSALIDSVTDYALGCLDAAQNLIATQLYSYYNGQLTLLPDEHQFAAAVLGEHAGPGDELADPATALADLWRPDSEPIFGG